MSNRTIREQNLLLGIIFASFEKHANEMRRLGQKPDDDSEYPRLDRLASDADRKRKERAE